MKRVLFAATLAACTGSFVHGSSAFAAAAPSAPAIDPKAVALATEFAASVSAPSDPEIPYIAADAGLGFTWEIPQNWFEGGVYAYPLIWDPSIPGAGYEILEQTPNFGTVTSNEYFSYTFAWWLEGDPNLTAAQLTTDFTGYYDGLMGGCAYALASCDVDKYTAKFVELADIAPGPRAVKAFIGEAQLYDEFYTGNLITLHFLVNTYDCPRDGHRAILLSASPEPYSNPVWTELLARQARFTCE